MTRAIYRPLKDAPRPLAGGEPPTLEALRAHRRPLLEIARRYGASNVRVIGSVARGQARPDSDVDLLVTFDAGASLLDHAGLALELEDYLGRAVQIASDRGLKPAARESILADAQPL